MKLNDVSHVAASTFWPDTLQVWTSGQVGLPKVPRWSKYHEDGHSMVRRQDSLQHSYSITVLGKVFCYKLRPHVCLDEGLLQNALLIHDHGEGEIQYDTHYIDKTEQGDLIEYKAFTKCYSVFPTDLFCEFQRAFLLQFALKCPASFPTGACIVMDQLAATKKTECLAFDAIERWDYVLYALEQFLERGNEKILLQVMRHQKPHLDRLVGELPGFGDEIWTVSIRQWFDGFLVQNQGAHIEQKGKC
ncbi:MAG: hypothetical protein Q8O53_02295 [Candidatus Moranbacteria bacterium]|nr:hypothetical protein [Candidatus Moranbacteria bacterium]